jgi:Aminoglycoside-2''-adenylyltransferase
MTIINDPQLNRIAVIMKESKFPWFIAGGWAIDLAIGKKTREHEDIDIVVFRENIQDVLDYFKNWEIGVALPGEHRLETVVSKDQAMPPRFGLHVRNDTDFVEVLLTDRVEDRAIFRRDPSIIFPVSDFIKTDAMNRRYITPEWQLLFKSKSPRESDWQDFLNALPYLSMQQKDWLKQAFIKTAASTEWIERLS